jgi:sigma-B regulation protein RsbU (phosphoserine phosphatase)
LKPGVLVDDQFDSASGAGTTAAFVQDIMKAKGAIIPRILVADDQPDVLEALRLLLKRHGYEIETVTSPGAVLRALETRTFDLLLMDLNYARDTTSGREGLDLLSHLNTCGGTPPIVVMTGWGTVGLAVEAMQHGVGDFVEKPWENVRLLEILRRQIELGRARSEAQRRAAEKERQASENALQLQKQEQEMEEARGIQLNFLPKEIPQVRGYELAGTWQPARVVGRDYFDVLKLSETIFAVCVADVAGKGVPAALLMSNLQATVRGTATAAMPPATLCQKVNESIHRNIAADRFVTFFYGLLDSRSGRFVYANAGHNAPILLRRNGSHERLCEGGDVLGIFPDRTYESGEVELAAGDRIVLFTDGLTEARNEAGEEFGESRLLELLTENLPLGAADLQKRILQAVTEYSGGEFADDVTLIVVAVGEKDGN